MEMTDETSKLHVRLSASSARRWLKARGFGVKRVEATGNQRIQKHAFDGAEGCANQNRAPGQFHAQTLPEECG